MTDQQIVTVAAGRLYERMANGHEPTEADAEALAELLNLQLIHRARGRNAYSLEDPAYVSARLTARFHGEAARQLEWAAQASKALDILGAAYGARPRPAGDAHALVEHLSGIEAINGRLGHIFAGCSESIDVCQPTPRMPAKLARVRGRDLATLGRGVRMRTLYHEDIRAGAGMESWVQEMTAAGAEIRTSDVDFPRIFIVDGRVTVIPGEEPDVARIVYDPGIAAFLTAHLFDWHWNAARPWGGSADGSGTANGVVLDSRQQRILELLAAGKSVKEVGTLLGVKDRRMAELMAELKGLYGAETPFQLAVCWVSSAAGLA